MAPDEESDSARTSPASGPTSAAPEKVAASPALYSRPMTIESLSCLSNSASIIVITS